MIDDIMQKLTPIERAFLKQVIEVDETTGIYNKRKFNKDIKAEVKRAENTGKDLSLLLIDIDDFKHYNDTNGHYTGDLLLNQVSQAIKDHLKQYDHVYRYGGEEIACLLPNTNLTQGHTIAERLRTLIQKTTPITISIGIANYKGNTHTTKQLIEKADKALYKAKHNGKNKTEE